jgi:hypothetical protein
MWHKKGEWHSFASCGGSDTFTQETLTDSDLNEVERTCGICRVRPECISTALDEEWSGVVVAGIPLPGGTLDGPDITDALQSAYDHLRATLPAEFEARGEDI